MIDTLDMFETAKKTGFNEDQCNFIVDIVQDIEARQNYKNSSYERDISQIKNDIIEIKAILKMMEKMFYALGALMMGGFGLVIYLVKG